MFAGTLSIFWPFNKLFLFFWGYSSLGFRIRLCYGEICGGFRLVFNISLFHLKSLEHSLILFQLLILFYLIVNDYKISLKCKVKVIENPNFECVFNRNTLLPDSSLESIIFAMIFYHIVANSIVEFIDESDVYPLTCGILNSIPLF